MTDDTETRAAILNVARYDMSTPAPQGHWEQILARRIAGERRILPVTESGTPGRSSWRAGRRAAAILLVSGVVAAAMIAPVSRWVGGNSSTRSGKSARPRAAAASAGRQPAPAAPPAVAAPRVSGVAIPLAGDSVAVSVLAGKAALRIRVRMVPTRQLEVRGMDAASEATFRPTPGEISVSGANGGEIQVDVPSAATAFTLRVAGVVYMVKSRAGIRLFATADSADGEYVFARRP
jgi:hypothetical protein